MTKASQMPLWIQGAGRRRRHGRYEGTAMLILTRRVSETLMVGDDVTVTVLGVKGNQVRIGIKAPPNVGLHREEIYERIKHGEFKQRGQIQTRPDPLEPDA